MPNQFLGFPPLLLKQMLILTIDGGKAIFIKAFHRYASNMMDKSIACNHQALALKFKTQCPVIILKISDFVSFIEITDIFEDLAPK
ncbi:hypothetical protein D3C77_704510 [compost metagenome]